MIPDSTLSQSNISNLKSNEYCRLCKGGELFDEIIARGKFKEEEAANVMRLVLSCVNYLHSNNIVHR
jgi:serine/threonine protein kinase